MGKGSGGSTTSQTVQSNEPPAWARPLLEKSAGEAMKFYDQGVGYNVYGGPTQAPLSDQSLGGMNAMMAATGGGAPITNIPPEQQFPELFKMFEQQEKQKERRNRPPKDGGGPPDLSLGGSWWNDWGMAGPNPYQKPDDYFMSDAQFQKMMTPIDQGGRNINLPPWHQDFASRIAALQSDPGQFAPGVYGQPGPSFPPNPDLPPGVDQPYGRRRR